MSNRLIKNKSKNLQRGYKRRIPDSSQIQLHSNITLKILAHRCNYPNHCDSQIIAEALNQKKTNELDKLSSSEKKHLLKNINGHFKVNKEKKIFIDNAELFQALLTPNTQEDYLNWPLNLLNIGNLAYKKWLKLKLAIKINRNQPGLYLTNQTIRDIIYGFALIAQGKAMDKLDAPSSSNLWAILSKLSIGDISSKQIANILYGVGILLKNNLVVTQLKRTTLDIIESLIARLNHLTQISKGKDNPSAKEIANALYSIAIFLQKTPICLKKEAQTNFIALLESLVNKKNLPDYTQRPIPQHISNSLYALVFFVKKTSFKLNENSIFVIEGLLDTLEKTLRNSSHKNNPKGIDNAASLYNIGLLASEKEFILTENLKQSINFLVEDFLAKFDSQDKKYIPTARGISSVLYALGALLENHKMGINVFIKNTFERLLIELIAKAAQQNDNDKSIVQNFRNALQALGWFVNCSQFPLSQKILSSFKQILALLANNTIEAAPNTNETKIQHITEALYAATSICKKSKIKLESSVIDSFLKLTRLLENKILDSSQDSPNPTDCANILYSLAFLSETQTIKFCENSSQVIQNIIDILAKKCSEPNEIPSIKNIANTFHVLNILAKDKQCYLNLNEEPTITNINTLLEQFNKSLSYREINHQNKKNICDLLYSYALLVSSKNLAISQATEVLVSKSIEVFMEREQVQQQSLQRNIATQKTDTTRKIANIFYAIHLLVSTKNFKLNKAIQKNINILAELFVQKIDSCYSAKNSFTTQDIANTICALCRFAYEKQLSPQVLQKNANILFLAFSKQIENQPPNYPFYGQEVSSVLYALSAAIRKGLLEFFPKIYLPKCIIAHACAEKIDIISFFSNLAFLIHHATFELSDMIEALAKLNVLALNKKEADGVMQGLNALKKLAEDSKEYHSLNYALNQAVEFLSKIDEYPMPKQLNSQQYFSQTTHSTMTKLSNEDSCTQKLSL